MQSVRLTLPEDAFFLYALSARMLKILPSNNAAKKHCRRDVLGSPDLHKYLLPQFPLSFFSFFFFPLFYFIRDLYLENLFIESYLFIKTRIHSSVPRAYRSTFVDLDLIGNSILLFSNPLWSGLCRRRSDAASSKQQEPPESINATSAIRGIELTLNGISQCVRSRSDLRMQRRRRGKGCSRLVELPSVVN